MTDNNEAIRKALEERLEYLRNDMEQFARALQAGDDLRIHVVMGNMQKTFTNMGAIEKKLKW